MNDIINGVKIEGKFFLAPMRAVNIASFRKLCEIRGAALVFSQMVDVEEFYDYAHENGLDNAKKRYVNVNDEKIIIQFIGRDIDKILFLIDAFKDEALGFDLNAGCPIGEYLGKKVGAYFMKDPNYMYKVVSGIREKYDGFLSAKVRSGWDDSSINIIEVAKKLKELKVDLLCVHPRTKKQGYAGHADWSLVAKIKKEVDIPIVLSGDVLNIYDAFKAFAFSRADYLMIGRAAKVYPTVFRDLNNYFFNSQDVVQPSFIKGYDKDKECVKEDLLKFFEFYESFERKLSLVQVKQYVNWFLTGFKLEKLSRNIANASSVKEISNIISKKL